MTSSLSDPRRHVWAFRRYQFLSFMTQGIVNPLLMPLLRSRGLNDEQIGWIQALHWTAAAAMPFVWGMASDSARDRRMPLLAATLGAAVSFCAFYTCSAFVAFAVTMLVFAAFFRGIVPMGIALTFAWAEPRGVDYSRIRIFGTIGYVASLLLIYLPLRGRTDLSPIFPGYLLFAGLAAWGLMALPRLEGTGRRKFDPGALKLFARRDFLICLICTFFAQGAMGTHYVFFSLYLQQDLSVAPAHLSLFWAFGSVLEVLMFLVTGPMVRRFGTKWLLVLGMLGIAVRLAVYAAFPSVPVIFLVQGLHALTFAAVHVSTVTFVNYRAPEKWRSSAQTIWEGVTIGLGTSAGALSGGFIAHAWGYRTLFAVMSAVAAAAMVAFALFGRAAEQTREARVPFAPDPAEE